MTVFRRHVSTPGAAVLTLLAISALPLPWSPRSPARAEAQESSSAILAACIQAQQRVVLAADRANVRLESARQTNSAAAMRTAMDDLQAALVEIKTQAAMCSPLQAPAGQMDHAAMGHAAPAPASPASPQPPAGAAALTEAVDPVCGMTVDPRTALQATHAGTTYYFCSAQDRDLFVKTPEKYVKPGAR
jgi:YHS domain-containing protein